MAQDIIIAGAQYPEVPAINIPKTAGGTALFVDTSEDTVTAEKIRSGITAHDKSGKKIIGTLPDVAQATPTITVDTAGKITAAATQTAGIVPAGTKSATKQLTIQAGKTVTPSISAQTAVASQRFTTGDVKVAAVNGIIRVTYPAGDTCTCKNGSTTLTANASDGITVFIVPNTGTWTLTVTNGTKTATKTVSITATSRFANVTLAYFSATIKVTYPAKSTCVIKNSSGTQVASNTNTGTAAKTWTATVDATGTYTITATATDGSGKTKSTTVSITADGQVKTVTLIYELILFDGGDKTGVTGGWKYTITDEGYGTPDVRGDNLTVGTTLYWLPGRSWNAGGTDQKNRSGYAHTKNKINVTNYNRITAVSKHAEGHLTVGNASVALKVGTVSLDISALTGNYEVRLGDTVSGDRCSEVEISKLYLS